jgi:hypothetical protein|nr:MAG TPA: hypothetical protein [Caudoviricetes sp.]
MNKDIIRRMPTRYEQEQLENEKDLLLFCSKLCGCFVVIGAGLLMVG